MTTLCSTLSAVPHSSDLFFYCPCPSPLPPIIKRPALPHLERCVAVIHGVFNKEVLENAHGQLSDLRPLLQGLGHFSQQQTHQEVISAVFLSQAELQTLLCGWARQEVSVH